MTNHYTITKEGPAKIYENENVRIKVFPKESMGPIATVKVAPHFWSSVELNRGDAASMLLKIRKASIS